MHVGVRASPPTYRDAYVTGFYQTPLATGKAKNGRLAVTKEPQHAHHLPLIIAFGLRMQVLKGQWYACWGSYLTTNLQQIICKPLLQPYRYCKQQVQQLLMLLNPHHHLLLQTQVPQQALLRSVS